MKKSDRDMFIEDQIFRLRQTLDKLLYIEPVDSELVLELSEELDKFITEYYTLNKDSYGL